jgi:hypothetical protein
MEKGSGSKREKADPFFQILVKKRKETDITLIALHNS